MALQKKKRRRRWTTNRLKKYLGLENVLGWTEKGFGLKQKHFGLKKILGWKKGFGLNWKRFWVEAKTLEKKRATRLQKRSEALKTRERSTEQKQKRGRWPEKKREQEKCGAELKEGRCWRKKEKAETKKKRGLNWEDRYEIYFQHLFSFKYSQKNYGEFVYVEFNF